MSDIETAEKLKNKIALIKKELKKRIVGQEEILDQLIIALLCDGHCILIGVPGLAKTLIIKSLADIMELDFKRIQFTPDLMPSDITGTEILDEELNTKKRTYRFIKGPIFSNIVLADEINRTPPKTQSALLEAMQEKSVTINGQTYKLQEPFFVLATQNPIEQEGTYPLPEAQLDRFMFSLKLEYPSFQEEVEIIKLTTLGKEEKLNRILSGSEIQEFRDIINKVPVAENVIEYAVKIVGATRPQNNDFSMKWIEWGAGPRASQFLIKAAKAYAICNGRFTPIIEDVNQFLVPVLRHRIIRNFNAEAESIELEQILSNLIKIGKK